MDPLSQLAEHLTFLTELGVDGISRDANWRRPGSAATDAPDRGSGETGERDAGVERTPIAAPGLPVSHENSSPAQAAHPTRDESLPEVREDLGDCTRCKLHRLGRRQIVFGVGNPKADLMFIGEAPGRDEDIQGIPFVGRAGQLLTKMIEAMGYERKSVYIANVIKCRPPENRNPEPDEVANCEPFLFRQVESIRPRVIVALGTFAAQALLKTQDSISRLRGRVYKYGHARLIPTFHPAFLLRSPERKRDAWDDLKKAKALLDEQAGTEK
jgi:DNA polymerase